MGVQIEVYLDHDLPRFDDAADTLARLERALPEALAVRDYWNEVDPSPSRTDHWEADPISPRTPNIRRYEGPGSLFLTVTPKTARISTGGRWMGFLTIEPLRRVHLAAFRAIAAAMHSPSMAICSNAHDDVCDIFVESGTQANCIAQLRTTMGPPQSSVANLSPEVAEGRMHKVWFLEDV